MKIHFRSYIYPFMHLNTTLFSKFGLNTRNNEQVALTNLDAMK